jgi:hypothetical protein
MNLAETFGGIAVSILTYKHPLKQGIQKMEALTEKTTAALHEMDTLYKSLHDKAGAAEYLRKVDEVASLVAEMDAQTNRNERALVEYEAWVQNQAGPRDLGTFALCEKGLTESGEHRLTPFGKQKSAPRDVKAEAADAVLRHRHDGGGSQ